MNATPLRTAALRVLLRTLGIGTVDLIAQSLRIFLVLWPLPASDAAQLLAEIARHSLLLSAGLALALEIHEASFLRSDPLRRWVAVIVGAAIAVAASCLLISTDIALRLGITASEHALRLHIWWNNSLVAIVAVAYLTRRRESLHAEQRRISMVQRVAQARRRLVTIATRTGQSRLELQMVLDCLTRARGVYPVDIRRGDEHLERLAHYLRLTLGIASDAQATLAREAELAAARINVERGDADAPMDLHLDAAAMEVRFPADLLGPLAHDWLHHPAACSPRALRLWADRGECALRVRLDGPCPVPAAALQRVAASLTSFGEGRGTVSADAHSVYLEIAHA